ncbi:hypothetical protein [Effusibacillus dendaii]|uniref:Uncharacterized protein n=1 Tax=Effusibacillus dendaii TaxID=2743772 RepID=A0A7I8D9M3_9BACL|nr:hypothetical protein [Effusibacillus dendaii]BCJ86697.1 hypothetical protein skT53_16820 [Effusibacillus dendaii]
MGDCFYGDGYGGGFRGPTFRQRLRGLARSSTLVTVSVNGLTFTGRIIAVDIDNFEMVLTTATAGFPAGSIVNVSFRELNAVAVVV